MEISYLSFIENLEKNFGKLRTDYLNFYRAFKGRDEKLFQLLRNDWDLAFNNINSPGMLIMDSLLELEEDGTLEKQIKSLLLNNNLGLIEYTKHFLKIQYDFILNEFQHIAIYFNANNDESSTLLERLYDGDKTLTNEEYIKTIQIHFVEVFSALQNTFYLSYRLYDPYKFVTSDDTLINELQANSEANNDFIEPINLKYKEEVKGAIIKMIYETLNDDFIESMPFEEFCGYFKNGNNKRKIIWEGSDLELALLFEGMYIGPNLKKIKVTNDAKNLLCNTFLNQNRKNFNRKKLSDNIRNSRRKKDNRIDDKLFSLVVNINEKFE